MQNSQKISYWELKSYFKNIDFLIIGAGIVGYSTALQLRKKFPEAKILLIEQGILPSGASSKNAGFACFGSATELYSDLQRTDENTVWETVSLRWKGLIALRETIGDRAMDFHSHGSWDLITEKETPIFEATAEHLNAFNLELQDITGEKEVYSIDEKVAGRFGFNGVKTSFYNRLEGQIDTAGLNLAFYQLAVKADIRMLFGLEVLSLEESADGITALTSQGEIHSRKAIICTNGFAARFIEDETILPARAQVLITQPIPNLPIKGTFHYQEGFYYFRNIDDRILFGGGRNLDIEGETTTELKVTAPIMDELQRLLKEVIAPDYRVEIEHTWAGIMGVGPTKKPIIRQLSDHLYCGVRLGGMGVAIGSLVGKEIASMIKS